MISARWAGRLEHEVLRFYLGILEMRVLGAKPSLLLMRSAGPRALSCLLVRRRGTPTAYKRRVRSCST